MSQLLQTVQNEAEEGEFDDLSDIMGELGGRPQELVWKEDSDGILFVGDSINRPDTIARIALDGGELTAEECETDEVDWRGLTTRSRPESAVRDRQYD